MFFQRYIDDMAQTASTRPLTIEFKTRSYKPFLECRFRRFSPNGEYHCRGQSIPCCLQCAASIERIVYRIGPGMRAFIEMDDYCIELFDAWPRSTQNDRRNIVQSDGNSTVVNGVICKSRERALAPCNHGPV